MSFSPTDLRFGQNIISNYLATIEAQQRGQGLDIERQKLEQQRELEEERLSQEHELETHRLGILEASQNLQQLVQKHDIAAKYIGMAQQGITPPGSSIEQPQLSTPEPSSGNVPISQTLGLGTQQQRLNLPPELGMSPVTMLNPEAGAKLRGKLGLEEIKPQEELKLGVQSAITNREMQKEMIILMQKDAQDAADRASREGIAQEETRRALGVASLNKVGELQKSILGNTQSKFDSHPIVRDYNTLKLANDTASGNPSDIDLLTAYHKSLNPGQASLPEYTYTLPQTLPSFIDRLGLTAAHLNNPKQFIPDIMRKKFQQEIQDRFQRQQKMYDGFRGSEVNKLKALGIENPGQWLTDYKNIDLKESQEDKDPLKIR